MNLIAEDFSTRSLLAGERYKAKIAFVSPHTRRNSFEDEPKCFLGVSLENRNFTPNRFHSMVEWAARRFEKCSILIGDHIHRITLQSTRDMPEEDARREAVRLGDAFMEESRLIVDAYRHATDFQYITCSEIQASTECKDFYSSLRNYFLEHSGFRDSVEKFGRNYHRHNWEKLSEEQQRHRLVSVHSKTSCHPADFRPRVTSHSTTRGYFHEKTPHRRTVASPNRSAA
ncbi:tRNA-dependent cyclodipeptide synthase [Pseudomonas fluorescens]|uniref:Cyclodipeptide synthase n=1 Tax=Pseudomonas fluorescens TaxID=294 RepID=A0A448BVI2_PSEFL|nr:Uncharacterised protein [Pseudomonas fluorescens]